MLRRHARRAARIAAALLISLATTTAATPRAMADDTADEAELQFRLGAERYQQGDYRGAIEHFLQSNRLSPNRNVIFNIARSYEALREYPDAFRYYTRALAGEADKAARGRLEDALKRLAPNVAIVHVKTDPPGATLYLDRKDLGQRGASPQTLGLNAGRYTIIAEAAGYEDATSRPIEASIGSSANVELTLKRILGTVKIESDAVGAEVRVDSEEAPVICTIPCTIDLPPGRHTLYVSREGFKTYQSLVDVLAKQTVTTHPSIEAKTGALVVSADEPAAVVEVDGEARGPAPALLTVPVGRHKVRVALKGFRAIERTVVIEAGHETRLDNLAMVPIEEVEAASRTAESVEDAPASVSIIPSHELRGMGYPTVWEALRGVRGVYLSDDRGYATAGFRGFGRPGDYGNRTLVLVDGQPMNDNWVGSSYLGYDLRADIEDVQRIEVVRGPGSVLYGTGAFSGVINIVTRARDAEPGYEVGVSTAGDGVAHGRARAAYKFGADSGMWTSVGVARGAGSSFFFPEYANGSPASIGGTTPGYLDRFNSATWTGRAWWKSITAQWSLNTHDKHLPTGQFQTLFGDDRTQQTDTRAMFEVRAEPKINDQLQSLSRVHVNYYSYRGDFAYGFDVGGMSRQTFYGEWAGAEQRFIYSPFPELRLTAGGEVQRHFKADQLVDGEVFSAPATNGVTLDDHHTFTVAAGYVVADVTPSQVVKLSAGARLDSYTTFGSSINPRIALIVKPYEAGNLKLLFGKAFRAPSIYELYYSQPGLGGQVPNTNLNPEQMISAEIEYSHRFSPVVVGLVSVYDNVITGLVRQQAAPGTNPGDDISQYQNTTAPVVTLGAETEVRREWKEGWLVSASYSFQRTKYVLDGSASSILGLKSNPNFREVPNAPEHLASLRGGAPILGRALMAMTRVSFTGQRYDRNDTPSDPAQQKTDPAVVWDLVLTGQEQRWHLRYALGVYNVFDWRYAVPVSQEFQQTAIVQNGRTIMASAYVDF